MSLNKTLHFLYSTCVGAMFRQKKKKVFAGIFASEFCEIQLEFTVILKFNKRNWFGVRCRRSILSQRILHISEAGVSEKEGRRREHWMEKWEAQSMQSQQTRFRECSQKSEQRRLRMVSRFWVLSQNRSWETLLRCKRSVLQSWGPKLGDETSKRWEHCVLWVWGRNCRKTYNNSGLRGQRIL